MELGTSQVSASTLYRFSKVNRLHDLKSFFQFKKQYENFLNNNRIDNIKSIYQHGICGKNQHKHTVIVDRIGNIKIHDLSKVLEDEDLVGYMNQRLIYLSEKIVAEKEQIVWIIDLNGKIMQLASKKILESLQKIIVNLQRFFPELLYRLIFVNTPMLFDTIWAKVSGSIAKQTLQKILMIGDESATLYQYAEQAILPQFLGGQLSQQDFLFSNGQKRQNKQEQESSEEEVDFSSLKQALSGLKIGGPSLQSISQTPLNTEADDK